MKIKICGLFREADIDYVNEARPDYIGFVFAESKRKVLPAQALRLRLRLAGGIIPVGVFVDAPAEDVAAVYRSGAIKIAQLHGTEDEAYIASLRDASAEGGLPPVQVIKVIKSAALEAGIPADSSADYFLVDSGAGSGKTFDWNMLKPLCAAPDGSFPRKPWFLAGGIGLDNIAAAMVLRPFAVDVSSGAETDGLKDREKILRLTAMARKAEA